MIDCDLSGRYRTQDGVSMEPLLIAIGD